MFSYAFLFDFIIMGNVLNLRFDRAAIKYGNYLSRPQESEEDSAVCMIRNQCSYYRRFTYVMWFKGQGSR